MFGFYQPLACQPPYDGSHSFQLPVAPHACSCLGGRCCFSRLAEPSPNGAFLDVGLSTLKDICWSRGSDVSSSEEEGEDTLLLAREVAPSLLSKSCLSLSLCSSLPSFLSPVLPLSLRARVRMIGPRHTKKTSVAFNLGNHYHTQCPYQLPPESKSQS